MYISKFKTRKKLGETPCLDLRDHKFKVTKWSALMSFGSTCTSHKEWSYQNKNILHTRLKPVDGRAYMKEKIVH